MEARLKPIIFINVLYPFQSTRPRGRDCEPQRATHAREISIHAPRMGARLQVSSAFATFIAFQSTRPVWGATRYATTSC